MLVHWIWLAHRPGFGPRTKAQLLEHFRDPEAVYYADEEALGQLGLSSDVRAALLDKNLDSSEKILEDCQKKRLNILTLQDAAYPSRLKNIPDPPLVLYYKGQLPDFDGSPVIGVVGTRKASAYGLTVAKRMGYQIGKCGGLVVSGMAYGIDGLAMSGALTAGAKTVGVLGCGADIVYPQSNRSLFRDVERYGCILSEFAPGQNAAKWTFPMRNRIISGLSCGVLVVEAPEKSGALITARLALEQGRDVFAVPGNIDMPTCAGSNELLRDGAIMVSSGWDVLSEYQSLFPDKIHREDAPCLQRAYPQELAGQEGEKMPPRVAQTPRIPEETTHLKKNLEKKSIDKEPVEAYSDVNVDLSRLSEDEQRIVLCLKNGQRLVDDVIAETGMTTGKLLGALTMLELKGVIRRLPGKRISLK
ncbi:MAG: DNA-processing protein DprA [Clostridiales bacterium]|nr:DNA-processing protein DprA [Clostridiales bacterium]